MFFQIRNKDGEIEMDQIGKLVIALIFLIVAITIIIFVLRERIADQSGSAVDAISNVLE